MATQSVVELERRFITVSKQAHALDTDIPLIRAWLSNRSEGWAELLAQPCVVVLGEAGTGKTTEFQERVRLLRADGNSAFFIPLEDLALKDFDRCLDYHDLQNFERWASASTHGYFFLDSLDEALLSGGSLERALRNLSHGLGPAASRARLFVSCRVSDWRFDADQVVLKSFLARSKSTSGAEDATASSDQPEVNVVQFAPLQAEQVRRLARHLGVVDIDSLDQAIRDAHAHAFVERPQDGEWLCKHWNQYHRLGSLTELIESNIAEKVQERPDRRSNLSAERAREGVTLLAGIATLSAHRSFVLPASQGEPMPAVPSSDPRKVLVGWSDAEIQQLLTRPIFDESTYGRVRIHHRTVQDYLGAQWLHNLLEQGMPRRDLYYLLFPRVAGEQIIPDHLQASVAWLALWDDEVRRRVIKIAPQILIGLGDPSGLDPRERIQVIRAYATLYANRKQRLDHFDHVSLARFASSMLAEPINKLLQDPEQTDEIRAVLLQMVSEQGLDACIPTALDIALEQNTSDHVRYYAIIAVADAGTPERKQKLLALINHLQRWDQDMAGVFIDSLFPDMLDTSGLLQVLERVHGARENLHTRLQSVLEHILPKKLNTRQRIELFETLWRFTTKETSGSHSLRPGRGWLLPAIANLLVALLDDPCRGPSLTLVLEILSLFRHPTLPEGHEYLRAEVRDALSRHADVRQALFWRGVAKSGKIPTRYWDVPYGDRLLELESNDIAWLQQDVQSRSLVQERLLAFDALRCVPVTDAQREHRNGLLHQLAQNDEALKKRLKRMENRPYDVIAAAQMAHHERRARARDKRRERQQAQNLAGLNSIVEEIRSGRHFDGLLFLHGTSAKHSDRYGDASVTRVREQYGDALADAYREGMKQHWRSYEPPLCHEREKRNDGPPNGVILGLAGLTLEVECGLNVASLEDHLAQKVVHYAAWELNHFPPWLEVIAYARPTLVCQTLQPALTADYKYQDAAQHFYVLDKLRRAPEPVRRACAPVIGDLLKTGDPPLLTTLQDVLEVLLSTPDGGHSVLDELPEKRCAETMEAPERFALWWCVWLERTGVTALEFLESLLEKQEEAAATDNLVERICNCLYMWTESYAAVQITFHQDAHTLARLIPLVYRYISPDDDLQHAGVYHPGSRDHAETIRSRLVGWLSGISSEEAVDAFRRIADTPYLARYRDWFLRKAEEIAGHAASAAPMSPDQALQWGRRYELVIRSSSDLFRVALDRLDDIRLEMEQGDFNYRELFNRPGAHVRETDVQKWLVSELRRRAQGHYTVHPEEEIDRREQPDIRLYNPHCSGPVSIEVKIAEKWTYRELADALESQLVEQYLRAVNSQHGIFLLCSMGQPKSWEIDGKRVGFGVLKEKLSKEAERIACERDGVAELRVIGIDFHEPGAP